MRTLHGFMKVSAQAVQKKAQRNLKNSVPEVVAITILQMDTFEISMNVILWTTVVTMASASILMALTSASVQLDIIWMKTVTLVLIMMNVPPWSTHAAKDNAQTQKAVTVVSVMRD